MWGASMPRISMFYGILIQMYWDEHSPPHFHASYNGCNGSIDIKRLIMTEGDLPKRALKLTLDWAALHQQELLADWELCQKRLAPNKIDPLP